MRIITFAKRNLKEIIRDPLSIIFAIILPLFLLYIFEQFKIPNEVYNIENFTPGIIIFSLSFITMFTSSLVAKDRSTSLTTRLEVSPMKSIDYICGDFFAKGYMYPPYVHNMNVLNLPFADGDFDMVMCNHVLEHIEDDRKAMRELFRVLKKGGVGLLQVPMSNILDKTLEDSSVKTSEERLKVFGQTDHLRLYGLDYKDRLEECGFRVELFKFPIEVIDKYGMDKEENLYVCYKDFSNV